MPSEVRHLFDGGQPYPVVRLIGVLDTDTKGSVRSALLSALARQPEALIADVFDLSVADPESVAVLSELARETADWPATQLVLCAPSGHSAWQRSGLPVWPRRADAIASLGPPKPASRVSIDLEPVVGAARRARELVTEVCGTWDLPDVVGPACIVITEMVNNVVAHAATPMTVQVALRGDTISVAVRDRCCTVPRFTGPVPTTSYGGRGLLLIDSVADRWGSLPLDDGKVVWAVLLPEDDSTEAMASAPATMSES